MMIQTSAFLTALVGCVAMVYGQQGQCVDGLYDKVAACFTTQNLDLHVQSGQQDATRLMQETQTIDPSKQCEHKEEYKKAIGCSLASLHECLVLVGMGGALPDTSKFQEGFDVVCQHQNSFDNACLKENYPHMMSCGERTVHTLVQSNNREDTMEDIICMSADVHYDCAQKYLQACDNETLSIYLEQLNTYQVPKACVNRRPGRQRVHYTLSNSANSITSWSTSSNSLLTSVLVLYAVASLFRSRFSALGLV